MYTKDKTNRITLRLNDEQMEFITKDCEMLGVSPSDYLRMIINSSMALTRKANETLKKKLSEVNGRENDKTPSDN